MGPLDLHGGLQLWPADPSLPFRQLFAGNEVLLVWDLAQMLPQRSARHPKNVPGCDDDESEGAPVCTARM